MILFKKQFKQKMLDGIKTTTYRTKRGMYYKVGDSINTNFRENGERIKIEILNIEKIEKVDYGCYLEEGFNSKLEMQEYFMEYGDKNLYKITFKLGIGVLKIKKTKI